MVVLNHVTFLDLKLVFLLNPIHSYYSKSKKAFYPINAAMDCSYRNVIYLIACSNCGIQFIRETKKFLRARAGQHCRDIENNNPTPVGSHVNDQGHYHSMAMENFVISMILGFILSSGVLLSILKTTLTKIKII